MEYNYFIILFKNKVKQKIVRKFITKKNAEQVFKNIIFNNSKIIFETNIENGLDCSFEIALVTTNLTNNQPVYLTDEMGRKIRVNIEDDGYQILNIVPYKKEELIYDLSNNKRINVKTFTDLYLSGVGLKLISKLNNKIIVQNDEKINLFSLKTDSDSLRFLISLENKFRDDNRIDCLFVKDQDTYQRKYLYDLLVEKGFSKNYLFRQKTTYPTKK